MPRTKRLTWADRKDVALGRIVKDVLLSHGGNKAQAARELGIDREHMKRLIRRYAVTLT